MKIKNCKFKIKYVNRFLALLGMTVIWSLTTSPTYAAIDIKDAFAFGDIDSLGTAISRLVTPAFSVATALVVFYFLYGAFRILSSGGDKEGIAAGRGMITHSIIGFFILMLLFLILQFLLSSLFGITGLKVIQGL